MRAFIRRYAILFALAAAFFGPFPDLQRYAPVGWLFFQLLPSAGVVGSGHVGVGGGGLWVLAIIGSLWLLQAGVLWLVLLASLGPAPKGASPFITLGLAGSRRRVTSEIRSADGSSREG